MIDIDEFNRLYWDEEMPYRMVADELCVSHSSMRAWIKKNKLNGNIELRPRGKSISIASKHGRRDTSGKNNPNYKDGLRTGGRWSRYGITEIQYNIMLEEQSGKCKICGTKFSSTPHIDHDHSSGSVRGLLCSDCNIGLGLFKDNIGSLNSAIKHLSSKARWDLR